MSAVDQEQRTHQSCRVYVKHCYSNVSEIMPFRVCSRVKTLGLFGSPALTVDFVYSGNQPTDCQFHEGALGLPLRPLYP